MYISKYIYTHPNTNPNPEQHPRTHLALALASLPGPLISPAVCIDHHTYIYKYIFNCTVHVM